MQLRPYQTTIIDDVRALMLKGIRSILVVSPTGSGKTVLTANMLATSAKKGMPSIFSVHRRELIKQSTRTFSRVGIPHGIIAASFQEDLRHTIQIASISTLKNRLHRVGKPKLMIWDECHHIAAASWRDIFRSMPNTFHIGLTATPRRLDGSGLGEFFQAMVMGPPVRWLIDNGFLCDYKLFAPPSVNRSGLHTRMGDFVKHELVDLMDKPTITGDAIKHYERLAFGKRAVAFAVSIEHSKHIVEQFKQRGIEAAHVDGETPEYDRDKAIDLFGQGKVKVLSNVDLFGEGFDLPAIEATIMLRPTQSLGLYLQQIGRALRVSEGKAHAILLDHVGNCEQHGLPDEERPWSLAGTRKEKKAKDEDDLPVKICPMCFAAQPAGRPSCSYCKHVYAPKPREIDQVEGNLTEVDQEVLRARRAKNLQQTRAESLEDLIALGKKRGYKKAERWARHVYQARREKDKAHGGCTLCFAPLDSTSSYGRHKECNAKLQEAVNRLGKP